MTTKASWESFFNPRVVCVVGASGDPSRIGGRLVRYSVEAGFSGRVIPINPNRDSVFGIPALHRVDEVDEQPDWVIIALPRDDVLPAVEAAVAIGAHNICIVSSGFAEVDDHGRELQSRIAETAARNGARVLGPNCNGFMNVADGAFFAFTAVVDSARPEPGHLAVVTQSAAVGTYLINSAHRIGLGLSHWVHTGNESDVTALEVTRALASRDDVRAIALSFEVLRDLDDLRGTLRELAEADVALGVIQGGLSPSGRLASQAHTAALIGDEADLLGDLMASAGAFVAPSIAALGDFLQTAVRHRRLPRRPRLGLVTTSGGVGILMADAAHSAEIAMPTLSATTQERITAYAPFSHPVNPVDTTAQVVNQPDAFRRIVEDCVWSGELDLVAVFIAHGQAGAGDPTLRALLDVARAHPYANLAAVGIFTTDGAKVLQDAGVSAYAEPAALAIAVRSHSDSGSRRAAFAAARTEDETTPEPHQIQLLDEVQSKAALRAAGADVVQGGVVDTATVAARAAEVGFPVVLKLVSKQLPHKAAQGGVRLHLATPTAVDTAYAELDELGQRLAPGDFGILVEKQLAGTEVFVACVRHPALGTLIGLGPGGSAVEALGGVTWGWAPVTATEVTTTVGRMADGHADALAELVAAMAAMGPEVRTVEANPVILTGDGRAVVVDALIEEGPRCRC